MYFQQIKNTLPLVIATTMMIGSSVALAEDADNDVPAINAANQSITGAVDNAASTIDGTLKKLGDMISGEFKTQDELLGNLSKTQMQTLRDIVVAQEIAVAKQRAIETFGDQAKDPICITDQLGQSVSTGRSNMSATVLTAGGNMESRSRNGEGANKGSVAKVKDLLTVEEDKIRLDDIYPKHGTLTPEQKQLVTQINQHIIDPFPPNKISGRVKEIPRGQKYEAMRLTYEKLKEAPRQAQSEILAMKTPDFPVNEWAKGAWADMDKSGTPEGTDPSTGNMSYDAFISLFVKSRIDNPKWYERFDTMNDSWQLRQINMNTAMLLEIQYRQMKLLEHAVELLAQHRAGEIDKEYGPLMDDLLRHAESMQ
jgi:hypothetical protein